MPLGLDPKDMARYGALTQIGLEMAAPVGIGAVCDHYLGWSPWGIIGGVLIGFVGGMGHLLVIVGRLNRDDDHRPPAGEAKP